MNIIAIRRSNSKLDSLSFFTNTINFLNKFSNLLEIYEDSRIPSLSTL